jgi:hypothetical protein
MASDRDRSVIKTMTKLRASYGQVSANGSRLTAVLLVVATLSTGLLVGGCSAFGIRSGTEQPSYEVVETLGDNVEIRRYGPRLAAEVVVAGEERQARSAGFRKLAAFIFGDNRSRQSIAMTAPVSQAASEKIAMAAPVSQEKAGPGFWRVRFLMPAIHTHETLPEPNDPDITIVDLPPETLAVLRFSGSRAPSAVHEATKELLAVVGDSQWQVSGQPTAFFYDPPWTLWFLRRNEVAVSVKSGGAISGTTAYRN